VGVAWLAGIAVGGGMVGVGAAAERHAVNSSSPINPNMRQRERIMAGLLFI
jgi:hypothetical protein